MSKSFISSKKPHKNKTNHVPTIIRERLVKFGITNYSNMKRVLHPDIYPFTFTNEERTVQVLPARDVLPKEAYTKLQKFVLAANIAKGMCHVSAYWVAHLLREYGVLYCDGYYLVSGDDRMFCHSFCKYGDKYFDPTYEFGRGWGEKTVELYFCSRTYEPDEIKIYFATTTMMTNGLTGDYISTPTTVEFEADKDETGRNKFFMIDDDGYLQWMDNPYYSSTS